MTIFQKFKIVTVLIINDMYAKMHGSLLSYSQHELSQGHGEVRGEARAGQMQAF